MPYDHRRRQRDYDRKLENGEGEWLCPVCIRLCKPRPKKVEPL